ncbi:MAG: fatty acid CoA ligase family protein [Isosphaerales bacterium]
MSQTSTLAEPLNIAAGLSAMAAAQPHTMAVVVPDGRDRAGHVRYTHLTYRQLDQDSDRIAHGLLETGIDPRTRALVMVRPGLDFFSLVFALFKAGVVPVLIDPGIGLRNLGRCAREAAPEVFIGIPRALKAQRLLGWGRETVRRRILVAPGRAAGVGAKVKTLDDLRRAGEAALERRGRSTHSIASFAAAETAAILFTSGSTGPPKGAVYTHAIFQAQVETFRSLYAIEPGEIDLCTFPLFALFAPALGMTAIVPDMDPTRPARVDPARLFEAIDDFGVTNLFGSPALLRRLVEGAEKCSRRLPGLKRVISAGAPVSAKILERLARLLDAPAQIHTPYGATESLPVASIGSTEILGETRRATDRGMGVCVGRPVGGVEARIIPIRDDPIPLWSDDLIVSDGQIGEIVVTGPIVTREYFNRPQATALAKIADPARGIVYHRMGDAGYRDDQGRLWFCGRKSHRVILGNETLFTIPCEAIFNTHPAVSRTALVGASRLGELIPVICVEPMHPLSRSEQHKIRQELIDRGAGFSHTKGIKTILFHRSFPVDIRHNAKIFREKLAVWATRRLR